jgi:enamine deaminase RidA (YjgF/YER057c/UK114 family)
MLQTAGGILADDTQVLGYLTHKEDYAKMNEVDRRHFSKPYPNRGL